MNKKLFAVSLAVVVFLVGVIFGVLLSRISMLKLLPPSPFIVPPEHSMHRKGPPREKIDKIAKDLKLTSDQKNKLVNIIENNKKEIDVLFKDIEPKIHKKFESLNDEIRTILNDEQKKKFDEMTAKMKRLHNRKMKNNNEINFNSKGGD